MSYKRSDIQVRVSRKILWVGSEAYPLHNIARAQTIKLVPKRSAAVGSYLGSVIFCVALAVAAGVVAAKATGLPSAGLTALHGAQLAALVLFLLSTVRLIMRLSQRAFYALIIETAGTPRRALVSPRRDEVTRLVDMIMDAIDNPYAEFKMTVESVHIGDKISMFGDHSVGKVSA